MRGERLFPGLSENTATSFSGLLRTRPVSAKLSRSQIVTYRSRSRSGRSDGGIHVIPSQSCLCAGDTIRAARGGNILLYFNPRAHEGHDRISPKKPTIEHISIHVPTRGTTLKLIISLFFYKYFLYVVPKFMIYLKFGSSASSRTRPFTMNTALESGRSRTSREIDVHSHFA